MVIYSAIGYHRSVTIEYTASNASKIEMSHFTVYDTLRSVRYRGCWKIESTNFPLLTHKYLVHHNQAKLGLLKNHNIAPGPGGSAV